MVKMMMNQGEAEARTSAGKGLINKKAIFKRDLTHICKANARKKWPAKIE
jgi:hypothetical protein